MKRHGPPNGSGPSADLRVAGQRLHSRSDAGRATPISAAPRRDGPVGCHACGKRVSRIDLDGEMAGIVTAAEATHAGDRLAQLKASPSYSAGLEFELTGVAQSVELA
jgi:hypothetical protein